MKIFDCLVVGGGVVGCFILSDLARSNYSVCLIEKGTDVAEGASKANSGLIHAGFNAKPGSLKARLNILGNALYPKVAKRLGLDIKKTGALVVGTDRKTVEELYSRGIKNGVKDLEILDRNALLQLAPNLADTISVGLHAKNAYIINPYLLTSCLADEAIINGAEIKLNFETTLVKKEKDIFYFSNGVETIAARKVVNCTGANINDILKLANCKPYEITYRRGEYYVLDSSEKPTNITIFPLPSGSSKGVLITPTIDGNCLVGPTSYESDDETITTREGLGYIKEKACELLKNINFKKCIRQFAGVRSIIGDDFVIEESELKGLFNVAGICSPGLSAAPAISQYVIDLMGLKLQNIKKEKITPYKLFKNLPIKEREELIKTKPSYGKIICKCENITEGDILFALDRPLKISTIDAVKRRVRAGMGRCQGGFCSLAVAEIISKKRKIPLEMVLKDGKNSSFICYNIRSGYDNKD